MSSFKRQAEREIEMVQKPDLGLGKYRVDIKEAWIDTYEHGTKQFLWGKPVNHPRQYLNGSLCHTSKILEVRGNLVETTNTVYNVLSWNKEKIAAQQLELF